MTQLIENDNRIKIEVNIEAIKCMGLGGGQVLQFEV